MNTKSLPGIIIKMSACHYTARRLNMPVLFQGERKKKAITLPRCLQIAHKVTVMHVFHIIEAHCPAKRVNTFISNCKGANKITRIWNTPFWNNTSIINRPFGVKRAVCCMHECICLVCVCLLQARFWVVCACVCELNWVVARRHLSPPGLAGQSPWQQWKTTHQTDARSIRWENGRGRQDNTHLFTGFIYPIFYLFIMYDVWIWVSVRQKAGFHEDILAFVPFD